MAMKEELKRFLQSESESAKADLKRAFQKIAASSQLPPPLWDALMALHDRDSSLFMALAERLLDDRDGTTSPPPAIATILAPAKTLASLNNQGFYEPFLPYEENASETNTGPHAFLNVPYEELPKYLYKSYTGRVDGRPVKYELVPSFSYLEAESLLHAAAELYGWPEPLLFSPWSRRAVTYKYEGWEECGLDPDIEANELQGILLADRVLCWNVKLEYSNDGGQKRRAPGPDTTSYMVFYPCPDARTYVMPHLPPGCGMDPVFINFTRNDAGLDLATPYELPYSHWRITITSPNYDLAPDGSRVIRNTPDFDALSRLPRLRTKGDIMRVLQALALDGYAVSFEKGPGQELEPYRREHRYPRDEQTALSRTPGRNIYLGFTGNPLFLVDYAEYVLNFLGSNYPEFSWRSVRL